MSDARAHSGEEAARILAAIVESSDDAIIAKDLDGTGASAIARDITEHKTDLQELKDSEARLRSILESAVEGIVVIDAPEMSDDALRLGAYRVVPKPFEVHDMPDLVRQAYASGRH